MKTKIPWCDYTINPVKGLCPMACPYCYARRMYKRFKWDETIRYDHNSLQAIGGIKEPSRIFIGSTIELFGEWVENSALWHIFNVTRQFPQHTFIFLTKRPENLIKWSPFPENCWVGVSITGREQNGFAYPLVHIEANVKFISFEPLLNTAVKDVESFSKSLEFAGINWLIIGSQTQPVKHPPIEWVTEIIDAADRAQIPVFIKEPMASYYDIQRQEFPK